uniref:AlNc14C30G2831 protein n=1 Tax=Albugo laibachii Nc14 TaxID=890382 RepID=F0W7M5_9STRA|nr:AlNc14C30G2831 [Albugo laibachii Nc14]|eukprot:CCA17126.1 AlNc14C30G2831 [Albugo laibachii Nc14]
MNWFERHSVVLFRVSGRESHFKNKMIEKLRKLLGIQHHFVWAYSPWANGSVKVLNSQLLKATRSLLSKKRQSIGQGPRFFSLCQSSINHLLSKSNLWCCPVDGIYRSSSTRPYQPAGLTVMSSFIENDINKHHRIHMQHLEQTIYALHKKVSGTARKKNKAASRRHERDMACMP